MEKHSSTKGTSPLRLISSSLFAGVVAGALVVPAAAANPGLAANGANVQNDVANSEIETSPAFVQDMLRYPEIAKQIAGDAGLHWCQTEERFSKTQQAQFSSARACATMGTCDVPSTRDANIPSGSTPVKVIRIIYNVFRNTDGTSAAATQAACDAQTAQLNSDYAASRIGFVSTVQFINNTTYRQFADSEETAMKNAYATSPATQLNVYVVNISAGYLGVGTFAWEADSTSAQGGLTVDDNWFGAGQKTMTHEVGHCLGLWHTHHGVSEVTTCSGCWERADGLNGDTTGDFAADTAPTPVNYNCAGPGGSDSCSSTAWGATDPQNYMGYADDACYSEFSPQQAGRMHCWINAKLSGWLSGSATPTPTATATPSPSPTPVVGDAYEPDNSLSAAKAITVNGAAQTHDINPATDQDWVKFTTTAKKNIKVETNGPTGGDTIVYIYKSTGVLVTSDDDSGVGYYSLASKANLAAGTYYVKVISYNSASTISGYTVKVYTY
ncbi:DVUA0089 family protein [Candidatus Poribacteria bacterium]|nr:DVUA0089 family protein [Candidatus Poribacteria bacterium]